MGAVLILVLVEDGLGVQAAITTQCLFGVLILVLVEDGLGVLLTKTVGHVLHCLNPCFGGRWSRRLKFVIPLLMIES